MKPLDFNRMPTYANATVLGDDDGLAEGGTLDPNTLNVSQIEEKKIDSGFSAVEDLAHISTRKPKKVEPMNKGKIIMSPKKCRERKIYAEWLNEREQRKRIC